MSSTVNSTTASASQSAQSFLSSSMASIDTEMVGSLLWGPITAAGLTSLLAGKTGLSFIDINLIAAGTTAAQAAIVGPAAIALVAATWIAMSKLTTYANSKEFLTKWSWVAILPLAAMSWATSIPLITVAALSVFTAGGWFGASFLCDWLGSNDPATGNRPAPAQGTARAGG